ncbi:MAG: hypothetical protein AAF636_24720 [Pseudomonadota bacterium]
MTALSPGHHRIVVKIHNPSDEHMRFRKKAVIARIEGEDRAAIFQLEDGTLGPHEAIPINCPTIAARFEDDQPVGDSFVILQSDELIEVVAVYTTPECTDQARSRCRIQRSVCAILGAGSRNKGHCGHSTLVHFSATATAFPILAAAAKSADV